MNERTRCFAICLLATVLAGGFVIEALAIGANGAATGRIWTWRWRVSPMG